MENTPNLTSRSLMASSIEMYSTSAGIYKQGGRIKKTEGTMPKHGTQYVVRNMKWCLMTPLVV